MCGGQKNTCGWVCVCVGGVLRARKVVVCARACGKSLMNCDTFTDLQLSQELLKVRGDTLFFNYCVDQSSPDTKVPQKLQRAQREESPPHSNEQLVSLHSHSTVCTTPPHTHCCLCLKQGKWCAMTNFDSAPSCYEGLQQRIIRATGLNPHCIFERFE